MAGDGILLVFGDGFFAHSGEIIVRMVVFTHVLEAEAPIFILAEPALRRAVGGGVAAALPIAARCVGTQAAILAGLDPNSIEEG
jgi:hypothetical protein